MGRGELLHETTLYESEQAGERRTVALIAGDMLSLIERTSGPLTQVSYGAHRHGHKMLFDRERCARVLGVAVHQIEEELAHRFGKGAAAPWLSDIMDLFDAAGCSYTYVAWTGEGDVVFRSEGAW